MGLRQRLSPYLDVFRGRQRRVWITEAADGTGSPRDRRAHIELRGLDPDRYARFVPRLKARLEAFPDVRWVCVFPPLDRVVVAYDGEDVPLDALVGRVEEVERFLGFAGIPFRDGPEHPADAVASSRATVELAADAMGAAVAVGARMLRMKRGRTGVDAATVSAITDGTPKLRDMVIARLGEHAGELTLSVGNALLQGLAQGPVTPLVDGCLRILTRAEAEAARAAWSARESDLFGAPSPTDHCWPGRQERASPLPEGPVEGYAERSWTASLGAFGLGFTTSQDLESAASLLYAGLPKPARLGREAFSAWLGRLLARREILVMDRRALRLLDRVDRLIVDADLLLGPNGELRAAARRLARMARRVGLPLFVAGEIPEPVFERIRAEATVPADGRLPGIIADMQADGAVVACVSARRGDALGAADLGIGLHRPPLPPPFGAHLLCGAALEDATLIVEACGHARRNAGQGVALAEAGAGAGLVLTFRGLQPRTTRRVSLAVNGASIVALVNGLRLAHDLASRPPPIDEDETPWHDLEVAEVLARLNAHPRGLPMKEARRRRLPEEKPDAPAVAFGRAMIDELDNPLTPLLGAAVMLSAVIGEAVDAVMLAAVTEINALIGAAQRLRAERAVTELGRTERLAVRARREGREVNVDVEELVPGDVVLLHHGELVPADCRILAARGLEVDESSLTGESLPVAKSAEACNGNGRTVADRRCMLFEGSTIAAGDAVAVVVAIGEATESSRGLRNVLDRAPARGVEARLEALTARAAPVALASGAAVLGAGLLRRQQMEPLIRAGVSVGVAAVPEGLPLLATVAQLAAARRLSGRNVLVRNPRAVEALGRVDVLCADKTGTLTEGRIRLDCVSDGERQHPIDALPERHRKILEAGLLACPIGIPIQRLPHATDRALGEGALSIGMRPGTNGWHPIRELPFESVRGFHAVVGREAGGLRLAVKGAPEVILPRCDLDDELRAAMVRRSEALAEEGLRVLAVAESRRVAEGEAPAEGLADEAVTGLRFLGFLGFSDPVRPTAAEAVAGLKRAHVHVVMITGDHPRTAARIARDLGILDGTQVLGGTELEDLDDASLDEVLPRVSVFARVSPSQKVRIVKAYQRVGRTVAMTGDGANDAQAIRLADVGIALGRRGTAAARRAADVVVTDDRIETILDAIVEGRSLWGSVRDAVSILVGGNAGEVAFTVTASILTGRSPLDARQLLLVNLLTDAVPAMVLAAQKPHGDAYELALREGPDVSLASALERDILWRAVLTAGAAGGAWITSRSLGGDRRANTVSLAALVGSQLGQTLLVGRRDPAVWAAGVGSAAFMAGVIQTPGISHFFGCRPLGPLSWFIALGASAASTAVALTAPHALQRLEELAARRVLATTDPEGDLIEGVFPAMVDDGFVPMLMA
jgi:cation-transporting P-type ATPase I